MSAVEHAPAPRRAQKNLLPPTERRALGPGGGAVADVLWRAWQKGAEDAMDRVYDGPFAHGFHSWPAGLHPSVARVVVEELLPMVGDGVVADPFVGGGTVALAAAIAGRDVVGTDLNPLSRLVAAERCCARTDDEAAAVLAIATAVCDRSKERVRKKVAARAPVDRDTAAHFAPHTLMELAGLLAEIDAVEAAKAPPATRRTFAVCFSAILTKASRRRGDTDQPDGDVAGKKNVGRFLPSEWWLAKVQELLTKQQAFSAHHHARGGTIPACTFVTDDAFALPRHLPKQGAALIVTSPPYGGTYDYTDHHRDRLAFLGLDGTALTRGELFARRRPSRREFDTHTARLLEVLRASLAPRGLATLVVGDALFDGTLVDAARHIEERATAADLRAVAVCSAPRPDYVGQGRETRLEHLVVLGAR